MRRELAKTMYRCDLENLFHDTGVAGKYHKSEKEKGERKAKKFAGIKDAEVACIEDVVRKVMPEHFQNIAGAQDKNVFISAPRRLLNVELLANVLKTPAVLRVHQRPDSAAPLPQPAAAPMIVDIDPLPMLAELDDQEPPDVEADYIVFKLVTKGLGVKKGVQVSLGSGSKLSQNYASIAVHDLIYCSPTGEEAVVSGGCRSSKQCHTQVISELFGTLDEITENTVVWKGAHFEWSLAGLDQSNFPHNEVAPVIAGLMGAAATPNNTASLGFTAPPSLIPLLHRLEKIGVVFKHGDVDPRWFLTSHGHSLTTSAYRLTRPEQVFEIEDHSRYDEMSTFNLVMLMVEHGWEWKKWLPASKRKKTHAMQDSYKDGGAKVWYSGKLPSTKYMMCMLQAETLFAQGCTYIPHGEDEAR